MILIIVGATTFIVHSYTEIRYDIAHNKSAGGKGHIADDIKKQNRGKERDAAELAALKISQLRKRRRIQRYERIHRKGRGCKD